MIKTISRPDFAQEILSRYTSGTPAYLPGADLLFPAAHEEAGSETPLARSIQNIWMSHRAITENTVLNLHIHLDFLYSLLQKTVREIHQNAARHMAMLSKTPASARAAMAGTPRLAGGIPADSPRLIPPKNLTDRPISPPVREVQPGQAEAMTLLYPVMPARETNPPGEAARPPSSGRRAANRQEASAPVSPPPAGRTEAAARPAAQAAQTTQTAQKSPASQNAGRNAPPARREPTGEQPPERVAGERLSLQRSLPIALSLESLSIAPWLRELWQIGSIKTVNIPRKGTFPLPQAGWPEQPPERIGAFSQTARILPPPPGNPSQPETPPPGLPPRIGQSSPQDGFSPAFPRLSPLSPGEAMKEQPGASSQTISPLHPGEAQTIFPAQPVPPAQTAARQNVQGTPNREPSGDFTRGRENPAPPSLPYSGIPGKPETAPGMLPHENHPGEISPARMEMRKTAPANQPGRSADTPLTPAVPGTPATQRTPAAQRTPATQEIPAAPRTHATPGTPTAQRIHAAPGTPATQEIPATQRIHATPGTPATPGIPAMQGTPAAQEIPAAQRIHAAQETPVTPGTPAAQ
jgi:hypothetical protein